VIAYTVVSRAYVPHARVLARSFSQHNPADEFWALLIDDVDGAIDERHEPFQVLRLTDLPIDQAEAHRMAMLFGNRLIAAIKPWVFEYFLSRSNGAVIYIDSDIVVYDSLEPLEQAADDGVVLVPHVLHPIPHDEKDPDETKVLGVGIYNAGLFGTGPDDGGFIQFMKDRLRRECVFDVASMRVNEQRWLDFVPSLFPYRVVRDPGVDVAYWNLHERPLSRRGARWLSGGHPLRCVHFSSFDPRMRSVAGRFETGSRPRVARATDPLLSQLCEDYAHRLFDAGFDELHGTPFAFDTLPDGTPVYDSLRAVYADALAEAEAADLPRPPDPFDSSGTASFRQWSADAYRRAGLPLPWQLRDLPALADHSPPPSDPSLQPTRNVAGTLRRHGNRIRTLPDRIRESGVRWRPGPGALPPLEMSDPAVAAPPEPTRGRWVVDWLGSLQVGSAGDRQRPVGRQVGPIRRRPKPTVEVTPTKSGFIASGPRAQLDPGRYRATVEIFPEGPSPNMSPLDQALVIEVFLDGYVLGYGTATFGDVAEGPVAVDFVVPARLEQAALLDGIELRLLSRGMVDAVLGAVLVERLGAPDDRLYSGRLQWLAVMAAGEAGRRAGVEVNTVPQARGVVVHGPFWRLPAGTYVAYVKTRPRGQIEGPDHGPPVATLEAIVGESTLAHMRLSTAHLAGEQIVMRFDVPEADAGPESRVGLRLRTESAVDVAVEAISVEMVSASA
jgi:hypothetical protein